MTVEEQLREIQRQYDEAMELSDARIQRILDRIDTLRPLPAITSSVDAPARLISGRHKIGPVQPHRVHFGRTIEFTYQFPITQAKVYDKVEINWMGQKRLKTLNVHAVVFSGDTVSVRYTLVPAAYATADNTLIDSVRLI